MTLRTSRQAMVITIALAFIGSQTSGTARRGLDEEGAMPSLRLKHDDTVRSVCYDRSSQLLAVGGGRSARVYGGAEMVRELLVPEGERIEVVWWSPDGHQLATGSDGGTRIWNLDTGAPLHHFQSENKRITDLVYSPDGKGLAIVNAWGPVRIWEAQSGRLLRELHREREDETVILSCRYSPDGRSLAAGGHDRRVHIWNTATGKLQRVLEHPDSVYALAYSPDSRYIAVAGFSKGKTIHVWDLMTGDIVAKLPSPAMQVPIVYALEFSPDGRLLAAGHADGSVWLWDWWKVRQVAAFGSAGAFVASVSFSRDGKLLAVARWSTVQIWQV